LPREIVPVRDEALVELEAVTVMLVIPFEPDDGEIVIHEGLLIVSQVKLVVTEMFFESPSAEKLKDVSLAEIS
jgi:hypothetical protein